MHYLKTTFIPFAFIAALAALLLWTGPTVEAASRRVCTPASNAPGPPGCATWSIVKSPNPGTQSNILYGVAAVTARDIWAVGYYANQFGGPLLTLIEHWNGTRWSIVKSLNPGPSYDILTAVAALSTSDAWAVGYYSNAKGFIRTLIEHWDGTLWSVVKSPNPGLYDDLLNGVVTVTASDIWVVGDYANSPIRPSKTLIEHWDGTHWSVAASPNPPNSTLNYLSGVAAVTASDVWAVGNYENNKNVFQTLIEHWSIVTNPNPESPTNYLYGVVGVTARQLWL